MTEDLRQTIRSILLEELSARGVNIPGGPGPQVREELISINSDRDLARFVGRLLRMSRDPRTRDDLESGRLLFRLTAESGPATSTHAVDRRPATSAAAAKFDRGLVTEKHIHDLPDNTTVVVIGQSVRLTPLAGDAVRQAGIKIERVKT